MTYIVPALGLTLVALAVYFSLAECKRALLASQGDMKVLRQFGVSWMVAFAVLLIAALILKYPALYLALGGLVLVAWITMPAAAYMGWKIRTEGPMDVGRKTKK